MLTRVLLDTCAVRNHLHRSNPAIDLYALRPRLWKYRISIADPTMAELISQLLEGRLPISDWIARIGDLDAILDRHWPIFPGGHELAELSGATPPHGIDLRDSQLYYQASWRLMRNATSTADLTNGLIFKNAVGKAHRIRADAHHVATTMQAERDSWINYINRMQGLLTGLPTGRQNFQAIVALMRSDLGARPDDPPDLADKLDAITRMIATLVDMSLHPKTPYNPASVGRRGDAFDSCHLFAIPLPAIICTADRPFVNRLRATQAPQSNQVLTVEEFNTHVTNDTLESILGPAYYRNQVQRWRLAALVRWEERSRPPSDDWADWFAAEPIA